VPLPLLLPPPPQLAPLPLWLPPPLPPLLAQGCVTHALRPPLLPSRRLPWVPVLASLPRARGGCGEGATAITDICHVEDYDDLTLLQLRMMP